MGKGNRVRTQNADERKAKKEAAIKKAAKEKLYHRITIIISVVLALALVFTFMWAAFLKDFVGRKSMEKAILLKTENFSVNASEFTYLYMSTYMSYQSYAQYLGFSTDTPLKDQPYTDSGIDGYTWHDSFVDMTKAQINNMLILCEAANERGIELDDEDKKYIDDSIAELKTTADEQNMSFKKFLKTYIGEYVTEADIRSCLEMQTLAGKAEEAINAEFDYTDEELEAYCDENKNSFYFSDYRTIEIKADYVSGAEESIIKEAKAEAKATAEAILKASTDEEAFLAAVEEYYRDLYNVVPDETEENTDNDNVAEDTTEAPTEETTDSATEAPSEEPSETTTEGVAEAAEDKTEEKTEDTTEKKEEITETKLKEKIDATLKEAQAYTVDTDLGKWLYEQSSEEENKGEYIRKAGDAKLIEDEENGKYTVYVVVKPMYRNDYKLRDVRHILITVDSYDTESGLPDEEAKAKAEELLAEWRAGDATEESFGELAKEHSMDGDPSNGGLYEDVNKGQMVAEFEEWLFAAEKPGDTGVVKTEYGYHVMYYVGEAETESWKLDAEEALAAADYTEVTDEIAERFPITVGDEKAYKKVKQAGT